VTVLFILALALFSGQGYRSVWRELTHHGGADGGVTPSSSGLAQARRRVGLAPLAALFARLRGVQAAPGLAWAFMAGLRLVSWDATMLDVADSDANTAALISSRNRRGAGAFAKVRLMTLIEVGIEYTVTVTATHPGTGEVTTRTELLRLLTTITDPTMASAADLADCYQQRWESETGYKAIETCHRGPRGWCGCRAAR
jgi:hypothetical protein